MLTLQSGIYGLDISEKLMFNAFYWILVNERKRKTTWFTWPKGDRRCFLYSFSISCDVTYKVFMKLKVHNPGFHSVNRYWYFLLGMYFSHSFIFYLKIFNYRSSMDTVNNPFKSGSANLTLQEVENNVMNLKYIFSL